jgi:membrane protein required for colicin V production
MLILYIGTALVIWVAFRMVSKTIDRLKLKEFDRQIGFLFGLAKGGLYCSLITLFAVTLSGETIREKVVASRSGRYIAQMLDKSESVIPPEIHVVVQPYLRRFDERFEGASEGRETMTGHGGPWVRESVARSGEMLPNAAWNHATNQGVPGQPHPVTSPRIPQSGSQYRNAQQPSQSPPWNTFQR